MPRLFCHLSKVKCLKSKVIKYLKVLENAAEPLNICRNARKIQLRCVAPEYFGATHLWENLIPMVTNI